MIKPAAVRKTPFMVVVHLAVVAAPLDAQDPPPPPDPDSVFVLESIVVTARNRAEILQEVPIAITALSGRELRLQQVDATDQLSYATPNLAFNSSAAFVGAKSATQVFIRGVGQTDYIPTTDPGVAVYLDGIYMARSVGPLMHLLDIGRVEVLRGPQGTLFGRNAMGGAVSVHSTRPGEESRGSIRQRLGSNRMAYTTAAGSGRIAEGLYGGAAVSYRHRDGHVTRVHDGLDMGDDNAQAARGSLVWRPSDDIELFVTADYSRLRENGAPTVSGGLNDRQAFATFGNALLPECEAVRINPNFPRAGPPTFPPPGTGAGGAAGCYGPDSFAGEYISEGTFPAFEDLDSWGSSAELSWSLGDWGTLRSLTGYRGFRLRTSRDADNTPANMVSNQQDWDHEQVTQELQIGGLAAGRRLHWQTGLYLFREFGYEVGHVLIPVGASVIGRDYDNRSVAGFGQITADVTDRVSLTAGGRYTLDRKGLNPDMYAVGDASQSRGSIFGPTWPLLQGIFSSPGGPMRPGDRMLPRRDFTENFSALTVTATAAYHFTPGAMGYVGYSEGFKSGGFNGRFPAPPPGHEPNSPTAAPDTYEPEAVSSYELGFKSLVAGGRLLFNVALFRATYDDMHIIVRETFIPKTFNGGTANISGAEVETAWMPGGGWSLRANLGTIRAEYDELSESVLNNSTPILPDYRLAKTPNLNYSVSVSRALAATSGLVLTPRLNWSFTGSQYHDATNSSHLLQDGYRLVNAALRARIGDGRWQVEWAARNLTDERYLVTGNSSFNTGGSYVELVYGRPREWSVSVEYNW